MQALNLGRPAVGLGRPAVLFRLPAVEVSPVLGSRPLGVGQGPPVAVLGLPRPLLGLGDALVDPQGPLLGRKGSISVGVHAVLVPSDRRDSPAP